MADVSENPFTPAVSDRICGHMNDDHPDAVLFYVHHYGNEPTATEARMDAIDCDGMDITATVDDGPRPLRIPFAAPLATAKDAHVVLVDMLKVPRPADAPTA